MRVTSFDEHQPQVMVRRILGARGRALWLPESRRRWTLEPPPWFEPELPLEAWLTERELIRQEHELWEAQGRPGPSIPPTPTDGR